MTTIKHKTKPRFKVMINNRCVSRFATLKDARLDKAMYFNDARIIHINNIHQEV